MVATGSDLGASMALIGSPLGQLVALTDAYGRLTGLYLADGRSAPAIPPRSRRDRGTLTAVRGQLEAYFAGELTSFDLPLALNGSLFQQRVWAAVRAIPYGQTRSYAELADRVGERWAARAVGHANARNPIMIVVPCHRVIGATGALTGYAGGIERKRWLLCHEAGNASGARRRDRRRPTRPGM